MRRLYESPCELGALTVTGKDVFNAILKDESVTYNDCIGDSEWYDRSSLVNNLSFEVVSEGENGSIIFIQLYDINQTGNTDLFYKLNTALFDGDEEEAVNTWLKSNLERGFVKGIFCAENGTGIRLCSIVVSLCSFFIA